MKLKSFHRTSLLAALLFILTVGQLHAQLPPDAQAAMQKGILAAKEQEWEIAIQSFQEARKTAPNAPELFYNLGLAESKIPGRELRAACAVLLICATSKIIEVMKMFSPFLFVS